MRSITILLCISCVLSARAVEYFWDFEGPNGLYGWRMLNGDPLLTGPGHMSSTGLRLPVSQDGSGGPSVTAYHPVPLVSGSRYGVHCWRTGSISDQTMHLLMMAWIDTISGVVVVAFPQHSENASLGQWDDIEVDPALTGSAPSQGLALCVAFNVFSQSPDECLLDNVSVQVYPPSVMTLRVRAILGGAYDQPSQIMNDGLRSQGLIPAVEPYTALGYPQLSGGGGEQLMPDLLDGNMWNPAVDWVRVEVRSATAPHAILATRQGIVDRWGDVRGKYGGTVIAVNVPAGNYRIAVRHRNHLGCMTATNVSLSAPAFGLPVLVDFTSSSTAIYGTNARRTVGTAEVLWPGNVSGDQSVRYTGSNNDRDPILVTIGSTTPNAVLTGQYARGDVNLDGTVKYTGTSNDRDPILSAIGSTTPNNTRTEQLP